VNEPDSEPDEAIPPARDVFAVLADEHRQVEDLLASAQSVGDSAEAGALVDVAAALLVRHMLAEELVVYPAMRAHLGPAGARVVDHDLAEHRGLAEQLEVLLVRTHDDPAFAIDLARLALDLRHHAGSEEVQQFPFLADQVPSEERARMAAQLARIEGLVPVGPAATAATLPGAVRGQGLVAAVRAHLQDRLGEPGPAAD
jgi:hemerythrin superfamily protein